MGRYSSPPRGRRHVHHRDRHRSPSRADSGRRRRRCSRGDRGRPPLRRGRHLRRGAARRLAGRGRRPPDGDHGPVRLGQVDADAHPGRARPPDERQRPPRRRRDHEPARQEADPPSPREDRLRLPVRLPCESRPSLSSPDHAPRGARAGADAYRARASRPR